MDLGPKYNKIAIFSILIIASVWISILSLGVLIQSPGDFNTVNKTIKLPVIIRIDDIQDFAFEEGQNYLLNYHAKNKIPADLAVIPGRIGSENETINLLRRCIQNGSEISSHGWLHEDLGLLSEGTQIQLLHKASIKLKRTLGIESRILVPPMYSYNNSTLEAMRKTGYDILSSSVDQSGSYGTKNDIYFIPATVELSEFNDPGWTMKNWEAILAEVSESVESYGYAVIVLHPQEFLLDNTLNFDSVKNYEILIALLSQQYNLTDFEVLQSLNT